MRVKPTNTENSVNTISTQLVKIRERVGFFFLVYSHEITNQPLTVTDESGSNLSNAVKLGSNETGKCQYSD